MKWISVTTWNKIKSEEEEENSFKSQWVKRHKIIVKFAQLSFFTVKTFYILQNSRISPATPRQRSTAVKRKSQWEESCCFYCWNFEIEKRKIFIIQIRILRKCRWEWKWDRNKERINQVTQFFIGRPSLDRILLIFSHCICQSSRKNISTKWKCARQRESSSIENGT